MPLNMYIAVQGDDKLLQFALDPESGALDQRNVLAVQGAPGPLAVDPSSRFLYAARRSDKAISSFAIDPRDGSLSQIGTVELESDPPYLFADRTGRFLLSSYYAAGKVAVHPIGADGAVHGPPVEWRDTATGAHSVQTDPSNKFAFLPHIADRGPNEIWQFHFDASTGCLTPNTPAKAQPPAGAGPRHFCFHPSKSIVYFVNEQGCSVTAYTLDAVTGMLANLQTVSTLPEGFDGKNSCADIHITPDGRFVYASNRGHNSIARFAVDGATGALTGLGQTPTEAVPRAFHLDPAGRFLFAAGQESGRLAAYRVDGATGTLEPLQTYEIGTRPMWVLITGDA